MRISSVIRNHDYKSPSMAVVNLRTKLLLGSSRLYRECLHSEARLDCSYPTYCWGWKSYQHDRNQGTIASSTLILLSRAITKSDTYPRASSNTIYQYHTTDKGRPSVKQTLCQQPHRTCPYNLEESFSQRVDNQGRYSQDQQYNRWNHTRPPFLKTLHHTLGIPRQHSHRHYLCIV